MSDRFEITELEERIAPSAACDVLNNLLPTPAVGPAAGNADTGLATATAAAGC